MQQKARSSGRFFMMAIMMMSGGHGLDFLDIPLTNLTYYKAVLYVANNKNSIAIILLCYIPPLSCHS